jgi:hypothetical protein
LRSIEGSVELSVIEPVYSWSAVRDATVLATVLIVSVSPVAPLAGEICSHGEEDAALHGTPVLPWECPMTTWRDATPLVGKLESAMPS